MFGLKELKSTIAVDANSVECPVVACRQRVERQRKTFLRQERFQCPDHGIFISPSTFEYPSEKDNLLWTTPSDEDLRAAIKSVKRESRMARDNSEDAVTWNVFRYLDVCGHLDRWLSGVTQRTCRNAELTYWSYSHKASGALLELNEAREEFGEDLERSSEPDLIAVTDTTLFFIETKVCAANNTLPSDPGKRKKYLTGGDVWHARVFRSDFDAVAIGARKYELFRFWLLGTWMAARMKKEFYLLNVVLASREAEIEGQLGQHIRTDDGRHFLRVTWEDVHGFIARTAPPDDARQSMANYFQNKTIGYGQDRILRKAFDV